jgi:hypothetical protein
VQTGEVQMIKLPALVDMSLPTVVDDRIIQTELLRAVGKRQMKLSKLLMKAHATVHARCFQEVKDKLEASNDWE